MTHSKKLAEILALGTRDNSISVYIQPQSILEASMSGADTWIEIFCASMEARKTASRGSLDATPYRDELNSKMKGFIAAFKDKETMEVYVGEVDGLSYKAVFDHDNNIIKIAVTWEDKGRADNLDIKRGLSTYFSSVGFATCQTDIAVEH